MVLLGLALHLMIEGLLTTDVGFVYDCYLPKIALCCVTCYIDGMFGG